MNRAEARRVIAQFESPRGGRKIIPSTSYADALAAWTRRAYGALAARKETKR